MPSDSVPPTPDTSRHIGRRRAIRVGTALWAAPIVVAAVAAPAVAASSPTFSFTATSLIWEMPRASSNFFVARYTLVNDGSAPGKPTVLWYNATERISLVIDQLDPNWTVSAGPTAYSKYLTWVGPDIAPGDSVILGGTSAVAGYFRGTVANNPPNLGTPAEGSNFNTAASVTPAGPNAVVFYDGDNYP